MNAPSFVAFPFKHQLEFKQVKRMSQGTIYSPIESTRRILLFALVKEFKLDIQFALPSEEAYIKNFPHGKYPTFIGPKGYKLTEVIAITLYVLELAKENGVDTSYLLGKDYKEYAKIISWASLANSELLPELARAFKPLRGLWPYNKKNVNDSIAYSDKVVDIFEARLKDYTYLVGERITLADLFVVSLTVRGFNYLWGKEWRSKHPNFVRWWNTVRAHPILADAFPGFEFIDKPIEYTPPKKEKAPKVEKPKAAAAKPKAEEAEEEAAAVEEKKPKHPLELLGKSTKFNLDEWKRTYSNEDTRSVALPWFWEHYDPTEWSLWRVDYKYNDELTLAFMSNNLVGGFFNRLQASTKYLFGSGVVYGENNNNGIVAVFLVRGQEYEPAFDVAPDWESYTFKKLDPSKPEDKTFVEDVFAWDKPLIINGESREINDGKVFK